MPEWLHEAGHVIGHSLLHTVLDTLKILPFLFLTYLLMEFLEHKAGNATERWLRGSGKVGPLLGGALGMLPQCGFSAAASGLYTGRIVTTGTLIAVYLSTSDEMLPILISSGASLGTILKLLGTKLVIGVVAGFCVDGVSALLRRRLPSRDAAEFEDLCERENCHCEGKHFVLSALKHTLYITVFLLIFTFAINVAVEAIGEENIQRLVLDRPVLGSVLAALVGLIPNCASSIALTTLFTEGVISAGAALSGLLVNAGVGLAVLFRNNRPVRDSFRIVLILWCIAVLCGILIDLTPVGAWLTP
ncbi:MAG: arsenic efflux protein [Clostridia bacterium]|nr:arsenic efflux protein [Clostridia bacterium]